MRKATVLLLSVMLGCQAAESDLVEPALLYRTWKRVAGATNGKATPNAYPFVVEFARNSNLLYGTEKREGWCCSPSTYTVDQSSIEFFWSKTTDPQCALVNCALSELTVGSKWRIDKLTDTELVIVTDRQSILFEVYR